MNVRRILGLLCFAAFVVTLAVWPLSYALSAIVIAKGYGVIVDHGAYYFAGPEGLGDQTETSIGATDFDYTIEDMLRSKPLRWIPIRVIPGRVGKLIVVGAWVPPLVLAFPVWLTVHRLRLKQVAEGEFEVVGPA